MLRNTLILPEGDARLAGKLLQDAIDDLDVVLMLVIGKEDLAQQVVKWADQICNKTRVTETYNIRRVIWIRKPDVTPVYNVLDSILHGNRPVVTVLNFHDKIADQFERTQTITPLALERAFLKGHMS